MVFSSKCSNLLKAIIRKEKSKGGRRGEGRKEREMAEGRKQCRLANDKEHCSGI